VPKIPPFRLVGLEEKKFESGARKRKKREPDAEGKESLPFLLFEKNVHYYRSTRKGTCDSVGKKGSVKKASEKKKKWALSVR